MSMVTMSQSYWAADKMLGLAMPHAYGQKECRRFSAFPRIGWFFFLRFFGQLFLRTLWRGTENQTTRAVSTSQQQLVDLQILWSGPSMWNGLQLPGQRCFHVVSSEAALNVKWWVLKVVQYGYFQKYRYPKMDGLYWKTLFKWMIWGYHYFRKHPYRYSLRLPWHYTSFFPSNESTSCLCLEVTPAQPSGFQAGQAGHPLFTSSASPIPKVLPFMETRSLTSLGHWIHHLDRTFKCPNGWCSIGPILQKQVRFLVSIRVTSRFKVVINIHKSWFVFGRIPATILQKYRWSQWWWSSTVATMASSPSIIAEHQ